MLRTLIESKFHKRVESFLSEETDFQYIKMLGGGSYGIAYLIQHSKTGKKYVLKRMKAKHRHNKKMRHRFEQEINFLNEISLSNIPSVLSRGEIYHIPFYIMDYVEGQTFEHAIFVEEISFSITQSVQITKRLLELIVIIHKNGIVHRDLRIPNILFKENDLFIIDFGLAAYIKDNVEIENIKNPKKAESHISDLYFTGHFLLFLLYSNYAPTSKKEKSWQEELQLQQELIEFIERLLLIKPCFTSAEEALSTLSSYESFIVSY